ncbi:DUF2799 domain-containing protein [Corticibacter populi]|uniref:DUF2799 domain-containing protein n=1 Tax=Corticibacter populi TaxID=1550736 RepID=A0A3M6QM51_9BURK|nr:DUF2799 domain-containing protein [Corticibacter populi]RMX04160.1 DUF2799 domain-containing protein [Corticibacter populi]RZS33179.1 uncharacterized protein DUF2799 [Corticibacter populi]
MHAPSPRRRALPVSITLPVIAAATLALSGCASMSKEECLSADWREQGMRAALDGKPRSHIEDDRKACADVGVVPDQAQYFAGFAAGITQFCTAHNGEQWGRQGKYYAHSCPPELEGPFLERYRLGTKVNEAETSLEQLRNEQRDVQRKLEKAKDDAERNQLRDQLRELDRRLRDARDDLDRAERNLRG